MEEEWDYLCSELGILEDKEKQDLIRRFIAHSNGEALSDHYKQLRGLEMAKCKHMIITQSDGRLFCEGCGKHIES